MKLLPTIAQKVRGGPLTPNTVELSYQIADRLQFFFLIVFYSNRMQNKTQKVAVNLERRRCTTLQLKQQ